MMGRLVIAAAVLLVAAAGLVVRGGERGASSASAQAAPPQVTVKTFTFAPDPLTVKRGTRVRFVNQDATVHTVTSGTRRKRTRQFDKRLAASGGSYARTFSKAGRYRYFCRLHPGKGMEGVVVVK